MKNLNAGQTGGLTKTERSEEQERFAGFVAELRGRGRAPKTIGSYLSDWIGLNDWFMTQNGEGFSVVGVTVEQLKGYVEHLQGQEMRPATINRKLVFVKRYVSWAAALPKALVMKLCWQPT